MESRDGSLQKKERISEARKLVKLFFKKEKRGTLSCSSFVSSPKKVVEPNGATKRYSIAGGPSHPRAASTDARIESRLTIGVPPSAPKSAATEPIGKDEKWRNDQTNYATAARR